MEEILVFNMDKNKNIQLMPICREHGKTKDDTPMASAHQYPSRPRQLLFHHSKIFQNHLGSFMVPNLDSGVFYFSNSALRSSWQS